ncbi:3-deoxy-manno-octulosonate cytidylyltransferase [Sansalvadorimonas sp. 2012CJ34-2]|uniref:3-deoxy-manno-octulosonate cytidylyltransferase n=1 Tax=Parendozoicomonas callyspongiae TaxID=2942213 RepID=A0ABT0PEV5_9GAMM|nr:3-deoxy-manno-octulosonate cytidylyltransferase [Sansalvadorimonas sp. 2012CJ34-2]MCL6269796.1 3-deoxy-manno-octulosonate cytidylyltransferase [Sansalvadorimonas sp. 2012CJ34-2]
MSFTVVIPARYASMRLPGKPLADIGGKPMIQHVYEQACLSGADRVIIATDDERVQGVAVRFGAEVCMTSPDHPTGTDRLQEVVSRLQLADEHIVVNVQGDEPLIPPAVIDQVAENLKACPEASVSTLSHPVASPEELFDPNAVKVVSDKNGLALYFSRATIPWDRDQFAVSKEKLPENNLIQRHLGIYGYKVGLLNQFVTWGESPLEVTERLEQLRVLWNGARIHVAEACEMPPAGVDTQEDLERVREVFAARRVGETAE